MLGPVLATLAAMASFQAGAAVAMGMFPLVGPRGAAALRLVLGAAMLLAWSRPWRRWPARVSWGPILGLGASIGGVILMFYQALERLPQGIVVALQFMGPLAVALFGSRRLGDVAWGGLAGLGVWLMVGVGRAAAPLDPVGVAWALGAAACWGAYIVFGRRATLEFGGSTAALATALGAVIALPLGVLQAGTGLLSLSILPMAVLVGLFSTALPVSLEFYAMARLPARTFAVFMSVEPAFGVLIGLIFLHQSLGPAELAGIALVMVAAAGAAWTSEDDDPVADPEDAPLV